MTVRIERAALVLQRRILDRRWPGGAAAFVEAFEPDQDPTIAEDEDLVAIGLYDLRDGQWWADGLAEYGMTGRVGRVWWHYVVVDEEWGPTGECDWIDFVRLEEESLAWMPPRIG